MDKNAAIPTAAELRAQARNALRGNWGRALVISAVDTLLMTLYGFFALRMLDRILIPILYSDTVQTSGVVIVLPVIFWVLFALGGMILVSPFYTVGMSRLACRIVMRGEIQYSLLRVPIRELLKGAGIMFICAGSAVILPLLAAWIVGVASALMTYNSRIPDWLTDGMLFGAFAVAAVVICRRIFDYIPVYQLMVADPSASARELAKRSKTIMKGNRWRLFCLLAGFAGWMLLYGVVVIAGEELMKLLWGPFYGGLDIFGFVCSIVMLPLTLYMQTALAAFTKDLLERG